MQDEAARITRPAPGGVGLLILDMINDYAFDGADAMRREVENILPAILRLRAEADRLQVPVVYVNDNYGQWHSEKSRIVEACVAEAGPAADLVRRVAPRAGDFFVIKPQFSGFYATTLPVLLPKLGVSRVVLTGIAADICVLFTAADAHMRDYQIWAPRDAVASETREHRDRALEIMRKSMQAETRAAGRLGLRAWVDRANAGTEPRRTAFKPRTAGANRMKAQTDGREANAAQPLGERPGLVSKAGVVRTGRKARKAAGPDGPEAGTDRRSQPKQTGAGSGQGDRGDRHAK